MKFKSVQTMVERSQERLGRAGTWWPYPSLITFGLCALLVAQIFPSVNSSLSRQANPILLNAEDASLQNILVNVYADGDSVCVQLDNSKTVTFRYDEQLEEDTLRIKELIHGRVAQQIKSAALKRTSYRNEFTALLVVDQKLDFRHVRPVINALAYAGITDYGFQTRNRWASRSSN